LFPIFTIKAENSEFKQGAVCPSLVTFIRARAEMMMYPPHVQFDCPTWEATCQLSVFREVPSVDMPHFVGFHLKDLICMRSIIDSLSRFFFLGKKKRIIYEFWQENTS
jgi:hypothetical protein